MTFPRAILLQVAERAGKRCEYCRMHQSLQGASFHIEHVVPRSCGGNSKPDNLALCRPSCNLRKSNRVEAVDPESDRRVATFNSRQAVWTDHFFWDRYELLGKTPEARAMIYALDLNSDRRVLIRRAEGKFRLFPP